MKKSLIAILAAALAGCSSVSPNFENRLACTVAGDKLFVVSQYGVIGISSVVADADRRAVCPSP